MVAQIRDSSQDNHIGHGGRDGSLNRLWVHVVVYASGRKIHNYSGSTKRPEIARPDAMQLGVVHSEWGCTELRPIVTHMQSLQPNSCRFCYVGSHRELSGSATKNCDRIVSVRQEFPRLFCGGH